jgi:hypothetical protein
LLEGTGETSPRQKRLKGTLFEFYKLPEEAPANKLLEDLLPPGKEFKYAKNEDKRKRQSL